MGQVMLINASPRAPKSNSKQYAEMFAKVCPIETSYFAVTRNNHRELCQSMEDFSDVLLVFPLYADGLPVTLMNFLKTLEQNAPRWKPRVSVLINCGFMEPEQNDIAVRMIRLFCKQNGYPFGSVLKIGSGEAILSTPFRILVRSKMKKLAAAIAAEKAQTWKVTMPISKNMFLRASTSYWTNYGKRNGITKEQMETMKIEE
ncbi:hypothetical protein [Candidatus Agathobaculum pullicola]|uniref:hypothetical protein n=1 Tax=Candidatus Agathobaculum pullicola TaxID=2838426 RepID=UPI003F90A5DA